MTRVPSPGTLAQLACVLEVSAPKPGNVGRRHDFSDATFLDFLLSAVAIGPALDRARNEGVGVAVHAAVVSTRTVVASNTNLGMILLLAPLAAVPADGPLDSGVARVLSETTVDDARLVYEAIRLARPGGLGTVLEQDVATLPTVPLLDAMRMAADRDSVARQYAIAYADVFGLTLPALRGAVGRGLGVETAVVDSHLRTLAEIPDTLIARKLGRAEAVEAARRARYVLDAGWPDSPKSRLLLDELDHWLRDDRHARNPGTTADLVSAALFAALRDGTIALPLGARGSPWSVPAPGGWPSS